MPKPDDRGSLMNLKTVLPRVEPIRATEEMERQILGNAPAVQTESYQDPVVRKDVSTDQHEGAASEEQGFVGRLREGTVLLNAKVPLSLHTRLKRTSQFNDISMTDILLRGIKSELDSGKYSVPPETWGSK